MLYLVLATWSIETTCYGHGVPHGTYVSGAALELCESNIEPSSMRCTSEAGERNCVSLTMKISDILNTTGSLPIFWCIAGKTYSDLLGRLTDFSPPKQESVCEQPATVFVYWQGILPTLSLDTPEYRLATIALFRALAGFWLGKYESASSSTAEISESDSDIQSSSRGK